MHKNKIKLNKRERGERGATKRKRKTLKFKYSSKIIDVITRFYELFSLLSFFYFVFFISVMPVMRKSLRTLNLTPRSSIFSLFYVHHVMFTSNGFFKKTGKLKSNPLT